MASRTRRPSRIAIARWRRAARKGEAYIADSEFPPHVRRRVLRRFSELEEADWEAIERGLREWFVCSAWRGRSVLGMPSRVVDEAWHEFILDSLAYVRFCNGAFGSYLHHTPRGGDVDPDGRRARQHGPVPGTARPREPNRESVLWDLDERLGIPEPLSLDGLQLTAARSRAASAAGPVAGGCAAVGGCGAGGGDGGGGCGGGGGG